MKHTPGPWEVEPNGAAFNLISPDRADHFAILLGMESNELGEHQANARLIAAAPDGYDLAVAVATHFADTDAPLGEMARALLGKVDQ